VADRSDESNSTDNTRGMIANYLQKQGLPLTNANYALALKRNAESPGSIPGLRNMDTVTSEGDPGYTGPSRKSGGGGGGGKSAPSKPTGAVAGRQDRSDNRENAAVRGGKAQPPEQPQGGGLSSGKLDSSDLAAMLLGGGALGAGAYGVNRYMSRPNPLQVEGQPPADGPPLRVGETRPPAAPQGEVYGPPEPPYGPPPPRGTPPGMGSDGMTTAIDTAVAEPPARAPSSDGMGSGQLRAPPTVDSPVTGSVPVTQPTPAPGATAAPPTEESYLAKLRSLLGASIEAPKPGMLRPRTVPRL
jgi:hypothetical protein